MISDVFNLAELGGQSPALVAVVIPEEVEIFYFAVEMGEDSTRLCSVKLGSRDRIFDLREIIAVQEDGAREHDIVIWKVGPPGFHPTPVANIVHIASRSSLHIAYYVLPKTLRE